MYNYIASHFIPEYERKSPQRSPTFYFIALKDQRVRPASQKIIRGLSFLYLYETEVEVEVSVSFFFSVTVLELQSVKSPIWIDRVTNFSLRGMS